jgi:FKBP-type peptidyl-prolyl cis-trans isomerase (trigger factor)
MAAKKTPQTKPSTSNKDIAVAKLDDGTVQITFTIPYTQIQKERTHVEKELIEGIEVPGFRKGKAPLEKALEKVPESTVIEHTLQHILPPLLGKAMTEEKLRLAIYPKFELLKANKDEDWIVRAISAELPEVELGDYKKIIKGESATSALWTPEKGKEPTKLTPEMKQQIAIKALLDHIKITLPYILIEEETNSRLGQLLERIERLGLKLESYLASVGKTGENLREEYEKQAKDTLSLDLILQKIADVEGIAVSESELQAAIGATSADPALAQTFETPDQRRMLESILRKRKVLDSLTELVEG